MPKSRKKIEKRLTKLDAEKQEHLKLLDRIDDLLGKAERRRKREPKQAVRWNRTLDNLEESLIEHRMMLSVCVQEIERLTKDLEDAPDVDEEDTGPEEGESAAGSPEEVFRWAAERLLSTPVEDVQDLGIQEVAMAKSFMESGDSEQRDAASQEALDERLEAYSRNEPRTGSGPGNGDTIDWRRRQSALRKALAKGAGSRVGTLTLNEVELIAQCHEIIAKRAHLNAGDERLEDLLAKTRARIREKLSCLGPLKAPARAKKTKKAKKTSAKR